MPRGLGGVGGAALSKRGSTVDAQEECTPMASYTITLSQKRDFVL